jgi:hypothetical protein
MQASHGRQLASLASEVRLIDELTKELATKKATLLVAIARLRPASISDSVFALVLRYLPFLPVFIYAPPLPRWCCANIISR